MNVISFAGTAENLTDRVVKSFEIIVAEAPCIIEFKGGAAEFDAGEVAIIPPLTPYTFNGKGMRVVIEQALLPFKNVHLVKDMSGGIAFAARQAQEFTQPDAPDRERILEALGGLISAYLVAFSGGEKLSPVVITVRDEIKRKVSDSTFSLEDCIRKLPLNYDYVRKLFKKETGISPHEYLLNCRMKFAMDLISSGIGNRYSNYSVAQIAEACGFTEPLYFSRVFKKYYGEPPSLFIKNKIHKRG